MGDATARRGREGRNFVVTDVGSRRERSFLFFFRAKSQPGPSVDSVSMDQ
jgi:hypothetical protein